MRLSALYCLGALLFAPLASNASEPSLPLELVLEYLRALARIGVVEQLR